MTTAGPLHVGFTGTRELITEAQYGSMWAVLLWIDPQVCHHGDCVGADTYFHQLAVHLDVNITIHPPTNTALRAFCSTGHRVIYPERPYLERNRDIVDASHFVIAAPAGFVEESRSGTWSTIRYARKRKKPLLIILPDGSVAAEGF